MNVFPFRKQKQQVLDAEQGQRLWQEDFILGRRESLDITTPPFDDFTQEIETIRANEPLMTVLLDRANEPATTSLEEVKKQIGIAL